MSDVSYGGDYFKAGVQIPYGLGGGNYQAIADAMNDSGEFYGVSAYSTAGWLNPFLTVEGFLNDGYYTTPYEVQSKIMDYIYAVTHSVDAGTWEWITLQTHVEDGSGARAADVNTQRQPKGSGAPSGIPNTDVNLRRNQEDCARLGLVFNATTGQCECGFFDSLMVDVGLKQTCGESALGLKSGLAGGLGIAAVLLVGFLIVKGR